MKKPILIVVSVLVGLVGIVVVVGFLLPESHTETITFTAPAPVEEVWQLITDVDRYPEWRDDLEAVERRVGPGGAPAWTERGSSGTLPLQVEEIVPQVRLMVSVGEGLPFGGTWTYELRAEGDSATRVTITEDGEVYNPVFRFVGRFIIGYDATLRRYRNAMLEELS